MQDTLVSQFIFNEFINEFRTFFQIEKTQNQTVSDFASDPVRFPKVSRRIIRDFYTWNDPEYRKFMIAALSFLEPVFYTAGTRIYKELDEYGEINFIEHGEV